MNKLILCCKRFLMRRLFGKEASRLEDYNQVDWCDRVIGLLILQDIVLFTWMIFVLTL